MIIMNLHTLLSPLLIMSTVIVLGCLLGKIKIFGLSLDIAGVLMVALLAGCVFDFYEQIVGETKLSEMELYMKVCSNVGTGLFAAVVGLLGGYSFRIKGIKDFKSVLIGASMTGIAFFILKLISCFDSDVSKSELIGALCGSLTTTPGLSAACEMEYINRQEAVLGYGGTYIFGVVLTVLVTQIIANKNKDTLHQNKSIEKCNLKEDDMLTGLIQIALVIMFGLVVGNINILGLGCSLGNSGGILCIGIIIGIVVKKQFPQKCAKVEQMHFVKNIGLSLFFVGTGIPAGMQLSGGIAIRTILYGVLMTVFAMLCGVLLCKYVFKEKNYDIATIIAGGMTSTPAMGIVMQKNKNVELKGYSLAYVGALVTTILLIRIC